MGAGGARERKEGVMKVLGVWGANDNGNDRSGRNLSASLFCNFSLLNTVILQGRMVKIVANFQLIGNK